MALIGRKKTIFAKVETSYGLDPTPTGAEAVLCKNLTINPIQATLVNRDLYRNTMGNSESLMAEQSVTCDFECEFVGTGSVGGVPGYDPLLRACAFISSQAKTPVAIKVTTGVATVTLNAHGYILGDKVLISGATDASLNGSFPIQNVTVNKFDYLAPGAADTPSAVGAPAISTGVSYHPVSDSIESVTIYLYVDSVLHVLTGARGTVEITLTVKTIPTYKFSFTGIFNSPIDQVPVGPDYTKFQIPQIVNTQNTPTFSLYGFQGFLQSLTLQMQNDVKYRTLVGYQSIDIVDRKPQGTMIIEAPAIATKDFFTLVSDSTTGAMTINHGNKNGFKVSLAAPKVLLGNPSYQETDGVVMLSCPYTIMPTVGDDDFTVTVR